jgi:hypothetical protein
MANPSPVGRRRSGVPNKVNTARVQRALAEGMVLALISRLARLSIRREKAARNGHNLDRIAARAVIWRKA